MVQECPDSMLIEESSAKIHLPMAASTPEIKPKEEDPVAADNIEDGEEETDAALPAEKKKKKKNRSKKPKQTADLDQALPQEPILDEKFPVLYSTKNAKLIRYQDNSAIINLGSWAALMILWTRVCIFVIVNYCSLIFDIAAGVWAEGKTTQTSPPTRTIDQQFPLMSIWSTSGVVMEYTNENAYRATDAHFLTKMIFTDAECIKRESLVWEERLCNLRKAAEVHRQVRKHAQTVIKPGMKMIDICRSIESTLRFIIQGNGLDAGQAFPTGCSLNNVAAHYSPNTGDETILRKGDVMKIDFGTHIKGDLVDSAFTVAFDPKYENLLKASQEATYAGVKEAGIDVRISDVSAVIQEVIESYEVEIDGKTYQCRSISNLCGHSIDRYHIHSAKSVPGVKGGDQSVKMVEGEQYAIETFASTGKGRITEDGECSHFMKEFNAPRVPLKNPSSRRLLKLINENFGTLAWCPRWVEELGETNYQIGLRELSALIC